MSRTEPFTEEECRYVLNGLYLLESQYHDKWIAGDFAFNELLNQRIKKIESLREQFSEESRKKFSKLALKKEDKK
jgi:hypothetical protein